MEHLIASRTVSLDVILILLSFFVGATTQFRIPLLIAVVVIKLLKLYIDTHKGILHKIKKRNSPVG